MTSSTRDRDQIIYGTPKGDTLIGGNGHDRIYGNAGNDRIYGGDGNDYVEAGAGNDYVSGGDGNDWLDGGDGNDDLKGGDGNDVLLGGAGNDELDGGDGDDWLDGGAGINDLEGNDGNDTFVFRLSDHNGEATGSKAAYSKFDGDGDIDTLRLVLTREEWLRTGVQSDVARFMTYLADHTNRKGEVSGCDEFKFTAFNLEVEAIERLVIVVDGLELDPRDEAVITRADAITATEDAASLSFNLLANDSVPDLVRSVSVGTASKGSVSLVQNYADPANPIANVVYTPNAAAFQYLAAGERAYDSFTYTVTDADGDVSTATVTVTILGQNDGPTIVSGRIAGAVTEDAAATLADTGTILFQDVDLTDSHTVAVGAARTSVTGAIPAGFVPTGGFGVLTARVVENTTDQNNQGQIVWSFAADNAQVQKLAAGQVATQVYTLTLTDKNGASVTQDVTVTLTGTNDGPTIGTATVTGATTEDGIVAVVGNIAFADVDLIDTHAVSFAPQASGYRGIFTSVIDDAATGDGRGNIRWNFAVDNAAIQDLAEGQVLTQRYTVTVRDNNGAATSQIVTVTITGTNDAPVIGANSTSTGTVSEAGLVNGGNVAFAGTAVATGRITSSDVDQGATATWSGARTGSYGSFAIDAATGVWTYTLDNARAATQGLKAGERVEERFLTTVTDDKGATATREVVVSVTGSNDGPVVTSTAAAASGNVREAGVANGGNTADAGVATTTGQLASTDVDRDATATWSGNREGAFGGFAIDRATGAWTYTLDNTRTATQALKAGETRTETFTATVTDDHGATATQVVTVTVTGTNDAPVITSTAADAIGAVREAGVANGGNAPDAGTPSAAGRLASTDVDHDATATWSGSRDGAFGGFAIDPATGAWTYTLDNTRTATQALKAGETRTETFTATVTDDHGATATQVVTVTVTGTNDVPVITSTAADATGAVREAGVANGGNAADAGTPSAAGRLGSTDVDHDATAIWTGNRDGAFGGFAIDPATGAWTYVLDNTRTATQALKAGETRTETFTATVTDDHGATATQVVTITVTGTNDAPVAVADVGTAVEGSLPVTGSVATNDGDVDAGAVLTYRLNTAVAGLTLAADGSYSFDPDDVAYDSLARGQQLTVVASYTVTDEFGATSSATLTIALTGTNDAPFAVVDRADLIEDAVVTGSVATNDGDVDNGAVLSWALTQPLAGLTLAADGSYVFDARDSAYQSLAQGETLTLLASYRVNDENRGFANGTLVIVLTGTNDAPVVTSTAAAALGTVVEAGNADDGAIVAGTPSATGQLTSSDVDHGATATWSGSRDGTYGAFTIGATGAWSYALDNVRAATQALAEGESFTDSFLATVTDDKGGTATQLVTVTVIGTNDSPVVTSALAAAQGSAVEAGVADGGNTPLAGNGAGGHLTSSDVDTGATATWTGSGEGIYGSFAIGTTGTWTYTVANARAATQALAQGQTVVETFTATVTDDHGATATQLVTITLTGTNDAPVITSTAAAARGTVVEAGNTDPGAIVAGTPSATGTLTASDVDTGATRSWSGTANGTYGAFAIDAATGVWGYALDNARTATQALREGQSVTETFTAIVTDEHGATATQVVTVTVVGTNDSPVVTSNAAAASGSVIEAGNLDDGTIAPGTAVATGVLTSSDVDTGATASWSGSLNGTYGNFAINAATGAWTYTLDNARAATQALAEGVSRTESFTATVTDDRGAIATQLVTVTVTGTNDSPVISTSGSGSYDKAATVLNSSQATAISLDGLFALTADANVTNSGSTPHVTIHGTSNANGAQTDWYSFTVTQAGQVTLDIDGFRVGGSVIDSWIELYNAAGTRLAFNDDAVVDPGSTTGLDSFLTTSLAAGTYSVRVGRFSNAQPLPANLAYTLHVSVQHPLAGSSAAGTVVEAGNLANGSVFAGTAAASGTLVATDVDAGATQSWSGSLNGTYGSFAISATTGAWVYTLDNARGATQALAAGQTVTESFIATVTDDKGATASRAVTIAVTGTNDAPVVTGAVTGTATEDGAPVTLAALANASDVDTGTVLTVTGIGTLPAGVTYDAATRSFTLDPANAAYQSLAAGQQQTVTVSYSVSDGTVSVPTSASWTITGTNDAPVVAGAVSGTVAEDASSTLAALANASDVDQGAVLSVVNVGTLPAGVTYDAAARTFTLNAANPAYQYLAPGESAMVTVGYGVSDGTATTATSVSWTVTGTNDVPRIDLDVPAPTDNSIAIADLFTLNGSASGAGEANLVQLTADASSQSGSAISIRKLDFSQSITFDFSIFVGYNDMPGADGVTLVLHNDPRGANATGELGGGQGVAGIQNGLAIEFDTYANDGEPFEDHTSFIRTSDFVSVSPVQTLGNIEDGQFHRVVVTWDAVTKTLSYTIDGVPRGTLTGDLVTQYFGGSDTVFFGFTGGTGGESNLQQVRINAITGVLADAVATNPVYVENAAPVAVTGTNVSIDDWNERDLTQLTVTVGGVRDGAAERLTLGGTTFGLAADASGSVTIDGEAFAYSYVAATATLTVIATDGRISPAALEALIETLRYADASDAPTAGTRSFGFQLTDASGAVSAVQTARIDVVPVNDAPIATPFANAGSEDTVVTGSLIATDVDSTTLTFALVGTVAGLTITADGSYVLDARHPDYQSLAVGETRVVTATYSVSDGIATVTGTLAITLTGTNDGPVITSGAAAATGIVTESGNLDAGATVAGTPSATGQLTASDVDTGATRAWTGSTTGTYGSFAIDAATGAWTYTLDNARAATEALTEGEVATDSFTVTVTDDQGATTTQVVTLTVNGTNDAPTAANVAGTTSEDGPVTLQLVADDRDGEDTPATLTYAIVGAPSAGTATISGSTLVFDPGTAFQSLAAGQTRTVTVAYTATDSRGAVSGTQTVSATQTLVNYDLADITNSRTLNPDLVAGGMTASALAAVGALGGTPFSNHLYLSGWGTTIDPTKYYETTLTPGANGKLDLDSVRFAMENGGIGTATWTLRSSLDGFTANLGTGSLGNDVVTNFSVSLAGLPDIAVPVTFRWYMTASSAGLVTGFANHEVGGSGAGIEIPGQDLIFVGRTIATTAAFATITVTGVNDAPVVTGAVVGTATEDGGSVTLAALANASDVDAGTTLSVVGIGTLPGGVTYNAATRSFTLNPADAAYQSLAAGQTMTVTVTYQVSDGIVATDASVRWTVTGTNDAPVVSAAIPDQSVAEDTAWSYTVPVGSFTDVDQGTVLTYSATLAGGAALPSWLSFDAATHTFSGTPPLNYSGAIDLTVTASDGSLFANDTFRLAVTAVNDAPMLVAAIADQSVAEDTTWSYTVPAGSFADVDSVITYSATLADGTALPSWLSFDVTTHTFSGTPPLNFNGDIDLTVTASDGSLSASDTFRLVVTPVNDAPVFAAPIADQTINEDAAWSYQLPAGTFTDVDSALTWTATQADGTALPSWLSFNVATHVFSGTPTLNYNGTLNFKVSASDGITTVSDIFSLKVQPVADLATLSVGSSTVLQPTIGGAIKTSVDLAAGQTVTFDWNFVSGDYLPYNDFAFVSINGAVSTLALVEVVGNYGSTGWRTYSFTATNAGTYSIGVGTANDKDTGYLSTVLVDNLRVNGVTTQSFETGTFGGWATSGTVAVTTGFSGSTATNGTRFAQITGSSTAAAALETFLGAASGALALAATPSGHQGKPITVPVTVLTNAGDVADTYIVIKGYPTGATFNLGAYDAASGGWKVMAADLGGNLKMTTNVVGDTTLSITAISYAEETNTTQTTAAKTVMLKVLAGTGADPIVFDLAHDGVHFATGEHAVRFDLDADGVAENIGWIGGDDALLVLDANGSGGIENGSEVVSEAFLGMHFATSMDALRYLDSNLDGVVDAADARFGQLLLWQDANGDGVSQASELLHLADLGITRIDLDATLYDQTVDRQDIFASGAFDAADGAGRYYAVMFNEVPPVADAAVVPGVILG